MTIKNFGTSSVPAAQRVDEEVAIPVEAPVLECVEEPGQVVAEPASVMSNATRRQVQTAGRQSITVLEAPAEMPTSVPAYFKVHSPVSKPANMSVDCTINNCEIIEQKWKVDPSLVLYGIIVNASVFFWVFLARSTSIWIMFLVLATFHNLLGLYLIYQVLCGLYNSTFVTITSDEVHVEVRPLRWCNQRPKCVSMESIQEICCKRCVHRGENNSTSITFEVQAIKDGSPQALLSNLKRSFLSSKRLKSFCLQ